MFNSKPLSVEYIEWARLLHNDPEVLSVLSDTHRVSKKEQVVWFNNLEKSKKSERYVIFLEGLPVGVVRLDNIDPGNRSACIGLDIHKSFRGLGYAKPIYKLLFHMCFVDRSINRLWLLVAEFNSRAINLYKSIGFKEEGVNRQALFRNGTYYNYITFSYLAEEFHANTLV
jgi:RimJ/RimL family protein N-acetyltransferase